MAGTSHIDPKEVSWFKYSVPLTRPLHFGNTVLGEREGLVVRLISRQGTTGWGEAAPLPTFHGWKPIDELLAEVNSLDAEYLAEDIFNGGQTDLSPSIAFALSSAVRWIDRIEAPSFVASRRITSTKLIAPPDTSLFGAANFSGYKSVKIKVGNSVDHDVDRVKYLRSVLSSDVVIRADANRKWTLGQSVDFARRVGPAALEFLEEPCTDVSLFQEFRDQTAMRVAVDESLQEARFDTEIENLAELSDYFVIKPTMIGSIERCLTLSNTMAERGKQSVISSAYETGIGMLGILDVLSQLPDDAPAPGIGTYSQIKEDLLIDRLPLEAPTFLLSDIPGRASVDVHRLIRV